MKSLKFVFLLAAIGICNAFLWSADPADQQQSNSARRQGDARSHATGADHKLASCIAIANQEEIAIARFAEEKARNSDVKEFAKMLVSDHRDFLKKLSQYAPEAAQENYLATDRASSDGTRQSSEQGGAPANNSTQTNPSASKSTSDTNIRQTAATDERSGDHHLDMVQLHRELASECIQAAKKELGEKDGDEFDHCFITAQVIKHGAMKTKLTVFERHASGDLKRVIAEGISTTERHKSKAEKLAKQLDSDQSKSRRDNSSSSK